MNGQTLNMLDGIISKYKAVKVEYLRGSPKEKWLFVRNIGIKVLILTGVPVLDPNYRVTWYSYAGAVVTIDIFLSFLYTLWYFMDTPINGFLVTPLFGILVPVN